MPLSGVYEWTGGSEQWLHYGSGHQIQIVIIEPLFEEKNRCRRMINDIMRALDRSAIGSIMPDLPGTGESLTDIADVEFADWQAAIEAATNACDAIAIASFRGGALLDSFGNLPVWRLAPETGARIIRDLRRTQRAGASGDDGSLAGHKLSPNMATAIERANFSEGSGVRTVRLTSDILPGDCHIEGTPLWRRAEPGDDLAMADAIAADLIDWVQLCANH